jgi:hypothetical protein
VNGGQVLIGFSHVRVRASRLFFFSLAKVGYSDTPPDSLSRRGQCGGSFTFHLTLFTPFPIHCPQISCRENNDMALKTTVALTIGAFLMLFTCTSAFAAGDDACSLLTQTQVSSVLGVSVGVGQRPSDEMHIPPLNPAIDRLACTWYEGGKNSPFAKRVSFSPNSRSQTVRQHRSGAGKGTSFAVEWSALRRIEALKHLSLSGA